MPFVVTIKKTDNARRGNVSRTVEFEDVCRVADMIGAIDGLLRQCFPDDMRHRNLNLSRDTTVGRNEVAENITPPPTSGLGSVVGWQDELPTIADSRAAPGTTVYAVRNGWEEVPATYSTPMSERTRREREMSAYLSGFATLPTTNSVTEGN